MSLASHDLVETDDSILNISIKYGYNPDSFSRAFKKIYKTTPIEYRKNGIITEEFPRLNIKLYVLDDLNLLKTNCSSCNWCILDNNDFICYASNKPISKLQKKYPNGCKSFKYNFESYVKNETLKEKLIKELMNNEK